MPVGLLRYQIFLAYGGAFLALWYAALLNQETIVEASIFPVSTTELVVRWAPLWGIVALGLYALISVIYGLLTFEDCPEAAFELERQIQEARTEMKRRGIPT
jgi:dolichyl-phosphate mannosyltransferase polypeptide 3